MSILGPMLGRPWLRRRNARLLRDADRAIDETGYVSAGGIDHFVTIRGASHDNPVLVFLHGGPGATQTVFAAQTLSWEEHVTVVQYDQRGSGKTRHRNGPAADGELSFERLRRDAIDLINALRHKLGVSKVILAASSAGSTFGLQLAASRPDLLHAYVGTDQNAGGAESSRITHARTLDMLRRTGSRKGVRALENMPADPAEWTQAQSGALSRWAIKADPGIPNMITDVIFPAMMTSPLHTMADIREINSGITESSPRRRPQAPHPVLRFPGRRRPRDPHRMRTSIRGNSRGTHRRVRGHPRNRTPRRIHPPRRVPAAPCRTRAPRRVNVTSPSPLAS